MSTEWPSTPLYNIAEKNRCAATRGEGLFHCKGGWRAAKITISKFRSSARPDLRITRFRGRHRVCACVLRACSRLPGQWGRVKNKPLSFYVGRAVGTLKGAHTGTPRRATAHNPGLRRSRDTIMQAARRRTAAAGQAGMAVYHAGRFAHDHGMPRRHPAFARELDPEPRAT